jgi:hypothetical protein
MTTDRAVRARREAIRAEYLDEEAQASEAEALENNQAVLSVRVPADLAETLKARAARECVVKRHRSFPSSHTA